jgi:hypothetical protein
MQVGASVAAFFAKLGYDTAARTHQTAANLAIPEAAARPIKRIELIADHKKQLQVYLFELTSVTVAEIKALARAFRNRAGQFLLVLTSDYQFLEFVLLDRDLSEPKGPTAISAAVPDAGLEKDFNKLLCFNAPLKACIYCCSYHTREEKRQNFERSIVSRLRRFPEQNTSTQEEYLIIDYFKPKGIPGTMYR